MAFTLDAQAAAVLAAAIEQNGPPRVPPVLDVASRRVALDASERLDATRYHHKRENSR